jgi:hypothetical protein
VREGVREGVRERRKGTWSTESIFMERFRSVLGSLPWNPSVSQCGPVGGHRIARHPWSTASFYDTMSREVFTDNLTLKSVRSMGRYWSGE